MLIIENLVIRNYRLFRHAEIANLSPLSVFVGANGSGKSTLFDVFSFLKEALTQNVAQAVGRRGGFRELVSRGQEGPIAIEIKFRESSGRLATYSLAIASDEGRIVVDREVLKFRRGQYGQPWHFVDFSRGRGTAITNEAVYGKADAKADRKEYVLDDASVLAIKGLGQFKEFRVVAEFRSLIENWHVAPNTEGKAKNASMRCEDVSRGEVKKLALLDLLHDPKPFSLLSLDTPECHLYPDLLADLAEELQEYARHRGQVLLSTHSPEFLNSMRLQEVFWLVKEKGFSTVRRAGDSTLLQRLMEEGDLPGSLWMQGLFEAAGVRHLARAEG